MSTFLDFIVPQNDINYWEVCSYPPKQEGTNLWVHSLTSLYHKMIYSPFTIVSTSVYSFHVKTDKNEAIMILVFECEASSHNNLLMYQDLKIVFDCVLC